MNGKVNQNKKKRIKEIPSNEVPNKEIVKQLINLNKNDILMKRLLIKNPSIKTVIRHMYVNTFFYSRHMIVSIDMVFFPNVTEVVICQTQG